MPIFANPWGLAALVALPAILALHLFWRRFRPRRVSGLFLWAPEARDYLAGRRRERLYRTASLLLELFAALALALAAAAPSTVVATHRTHLVVVLDGSASMSAVGAAGSAFAEIAANEARSRLAEIRDSDEATVILSGPVAEVAAGPRGSPAAALDAVDAYLREPGEPGTPFAGSDELDRAIALARELALPDGRVLVLTDTPRPADLVPPDVEFVSVGEPRPNVGFVVADRRVRPGKAEGGERIFVAVRNFSRRPAGCTVIFRAEKAREVRHPLGLEAGQTAPVALPLARSAGPVAVEIEADSAVNALALDDRVTLVPSGRPAVTVANLLEGDAHKALAKALASVPGTNAVKPDAAGLVFLADDKELALAAGVWRVILAGKTGEKALRLAGPYVLARDCLLLEDVSLRGVLWTAGRKPVPEAALPGRSGPLVVRTTLPLVSCGDHVLAWAIGSLSPAAAARTIFLDLDLARSNLTRTAAWPVLVSNMVEERRRALPGIEKANVALGKTVRLRLETLETEPVIVTAGGRRRLPGAGLRRTFLVRELGPARVLQGGEEFAAFHVNFLSPAESDLTGLGSARVAARRKATPEKSGDEKRRRTHWPVALLAALALAAAVGDWYVLRGRRQVTRTENEI